jgi:hypothetical protein
MRKEGSYVSSIGEQKRIINIPKPAETPKEVPESWPEPVKQPEKVPA